MRNMFIVDEGHLAAISKRVHPRLDVRKLIEYMKSVYGNVRRVHWFTGLDGENQQRFHYWLKKELRVNVNTRGMKSRWCDACHHEHFVERGVDVSIAVEAIRFAHRDSYDRLILLNGDGDLTDAVKYIRDELGKQVVIVSTESCASHDLLLYADEFIDLLSPELMPHILQEIENTEICEAPINET